MGEDNKSHYFTSIDWTYWHCRLAAASVTRTSHWKSPAGWSGWHLCYWVSFLPFHPGRRGKTSLGSFRKRVVFLVKELSDGMFWDDQSFFSQKLPRNVRLFKIWGSNLAILGIYMYEHPFPRFPFALPEDIYSRWPARVWVISILWQARVLKQLSLCLRKQHLESLWT